MSLDQVTLGALLDEGVRKCFKLVLVTADGNESRIAERLYSELITPEVAVMEARERSN